MRRFLLRLYPSSWRARYGDEFQALLEERQLVPFDVADVLLGALDAHFHRRGAPEQRKGLPMSRHLGGMAAITGGGLLVMGLIILNGSGLALQGAFVVLAGMAALVVAMAGLSSVPLGQHRIVTWAVVSVTAVGMMAWPIFAIAGYFVAQPISEWVWVPHQIAFLAWAAGTAIFGALTHRTGVVARPAAALLATSAAWSLLGALSAYLPDWLAEGYLLRPLFGVGLLFIPFAWIALGVSALRLDRGLTPAG